MRARRSKSALNGKLGAQRAEMGRSGLLRQEKIDPEWKKSLSMPEESLPVLSALVEAVPVAFTLELKEEWDVMRTIASAVASFEALAQDLSQEGPLCEQRGSEAKLRDIQSIEQALKAAGKCAAVSRFPMRQLETLKATLDDRIQIEAASKSDELRQRALSPKNAASVIAELLGDEELLPSLESEKHKTFKQDLVNFARLLEQALAAPDYATSHTGWHHLRSRSAYRNRLHHDWTVIASEARVDYSQTVLYRAIREVVRAEDPSAELNKQLIDGFLEQVGVNGERRAEWKPKKEAIALALEHEALLPLRSLNETISDMARHHDGLEPAFQYVVNQVTQHIVEGDFRQWRMRHPQSRKQLAVLNADQQQKWHDRRLKEKANGPHDKELVTREEDDIDLLWLTKIGGPTAGFDFGGHCLLPALVNARTRAIVVSDEGWTTDAGFALLRLLAREDGTPVLYLEPMERDFPHQVAFPDAKMDDAFRQIILQHGINKARHLGVPLSVDEKLGRALTLMGIDPTEEKNGKYVLEASAGVIEASDTLTKKHDWVQSEAEVVSPHRRRLIVTPED